MLIHTPPVGTGCGVIWESQKNVGDLPSHWGVELSQSIVLDCPRTLPNPVRLKGIACHLIDCGARPPYERLTFRQYFSVRELWGWRQQSTPDCSATKHRNTTTNHNLLKWHIGGLSWFSMPGLVLFYFGDHLGEFKEVVKTAPLDLLETGLQENATIPSYLWCLLIASYDIRCQQVGPIPTRKPHG